jgi:hypothetical protein
MSPMESGLRPMMGYLLWQIQHGSTGEQALADANTLPQYAAIPSDQQQSALYEALHNAAVSEAASTLAGGRQIGEATGTVLAADTIFGVRVLLTHTDAAGNVEHPSVVINATAGTDVQQILDTALELAQSGQLSQHTGHASPGTYSDPEIFQVVQGGLPGAWAGVIGA